MKTETFLADVSSLHSALDCLQTNIFIADRDLKLVYMNPRAEKTLKSVEFELVQAFGWNVEDFIGESIHRFHQNPKQVEKILRNPRALPHEAMFDFGEIHLKTCINGVTTLDGEIVGYVVNWEDISEKVNGAEEMTNLVKTLDMIEDGYTSKKK